MDSLVSFFAGEEDENSAVDMRALFNRCRALTRLGATVILIHHTNRSGETRGSSDFKPASDQAFLVSNLDRDGGRLLDAITLRVEKSRYGLSGRIDYLYAGAKVGACGAAVVAFVPSQLPPAVNLRLRESAEHGVGL